jgi:putative membrane protein
VKYLLIFLLVLAIFVISVTLGAQNDQQVTFNYLLAQGEFRISTLLAVLFAAGFAIGWLICGLFWLRVRVSLARASVKLSALSTRLPPSARRCRRRRACGEGITSYAGVVVSAFTRCRRLRLVHGAQKCTTVQTGRCEPPVT